MATTKLKCMEYELSFVNPLNSDPVVFCESSRSRDSILFDLGCIDNLSQSEILRLTHILISHTHLDHFYGFDRLLRMVLAHRRPLHFCGPSGIAFQIRSRICGYTWNLIDVDQIDFRVTELSFEGQVQHFRIASSNKFEPSAIPPESPTLAPYIQPLPTPPCAFMCNLPSGGRVEAVCLDHGIPSVAYIIQSSLRFKVDPLSLVRLGLKAGPWIKSLQKLVSDSPSIVGQKFSIEDKTYDAETLVAEVLSADAPRVVGYATDLQFNKFNLNRLEQLMSNIELFLCESNYDEKDTVLASRNRHLTTMQAAIIARKINARSAVNFHFSKKYNVHSHKMATEFHEHFLALQVLAAEDLEQIIDREMAR